MKKTQIVLAGNDHRSVDMAVRVLIATLRETDNAFLGPVPTFPKDENRVRRVVHVLDANHKLMPELVALTIPSTVFVSVS